MTHFVYPYKNSNNLDLLYSIRSIYKNFEGEFDITIIGDLPCYLSNDCVNHIPNKNNPNVSPQINIFSHQLIAANLYDKFVNMNDDIIFIRKTNENDLKNLYHIGELKFYKPPEQIDGFPKVLHNTAKLLDIKNIISYSNHVPQYFISELFHKMIKKYDLIGLQKIPNYQGISVDVLYYNEFNTELINLGYNMKHADDIRIGFWEYNLNNEILLNSISKHKILNYDEQAYATNPLLQQYLETKFYEKSPLEK